MANVVPVDRVQHAGKGWRLVTNYAFAAAEPVLPLVSTELARAVAAMPVAFVEQSGQYSLAAIMSLVPGRNLFVGVDGRWLGGYLPVCLRCYPFRLIRHEESPSVTLGIDEASGLVADADDTTRPFFDANGEPAPDLKTVLNLLVEFERFRNAADLASVALVEAGLIRPWPLRVTRDAQPVPVTGLFRVDEEALNKLDDATFLKLRQSGALAIAYAQLFSMPQITLLEQLSVGREQSSRDAAPTLAAIPATIDELLVQAKELSLQFH